MDNRNNKSLKKGKKVHKPSLMPMAPQLQARFFQWLSLMNLKSAESSPVVSGELTVRKRIRDIPYGFPEFAKGTENPVFRLRLQDTLVNLTASTLYNSVYNLQAQFLQNFDDLANMFDEYRFLRGEFEIIPNAMVGPTAATPQTDYLGVWCVDYGISAALGSLNAALGHDTHKWVNHLLVPGPSVKNGKGVKFPVKFEKLTDQTWIPTSTNNSTICFFKPYIPASSIPWSVSSAFHIVGWFDLQVRNQAG